MIFARRAIALWQEEPAGSFWAVCSCGRCAIPASRRGDPDRRYEVSGEDDLGDLHSFRTGDRKRADEMRRIMTGKLKRVEMIEILYRYRRAGVQSGDGAGHPDPEK